VGGHGAATEEKGSFLHGPKSGSIIAGALLGDDEGESMNVDRHRRICGCWWSGSMRALLVTGMCTLTITVVQTVAAGIANSDALLADCVAGFVDSLTYFLNIFVEASKGKRGHRTAELLVPATSIGLLIYFTIDVLQQSVSVLQKEDDAIVDDADEVNSWIVLAFSMWSLVFNIASMLIFRRNLQRGGSQVGVNMKAAFLNLGADFVRSFVTLIEAILIIAFDFNGPITDAWACCFVSGTILLGAAYAIYEWIVDAYGGLQAAAQ